MQILCRLTNAPTPRPRVATLRKLFHPSDKAVLDRALTLFFPGPNSYTGEDVAEFHVHGSTAVVRAVLHAIGSCDSPTAERVRYADAGEFTRRAFDNDRLDLTQIEGIGKLLVAETEEQRRAAIRQAEVHNQHVLTNANLGWTQNLVCLLAKGGHQVPCSHRSYHRLWRR
jgi:tRNA modification GTPase